eukprot:m.164073 g.164073  ORF g.164073 m.164073 type:complete len:205 (-) comp16569_c1_seq2:2812-3426(-)
MSGIVEKISRWDKAVSRRLYLRPSSPYYDGAHLVMLWLEYSGHGVPWFIAVLILFLLGDSSGFSPSVTLNLLTLLVVDLLLAALIKAIVQRPRPGYNNKGDMFATVSVDKYSFPSGHTTRVVTIAALAQALTMRSSTAAAIAVWAAFVSTSRIVLGRHHVLDVVAGAIIGLSTAYGLLAYVWIDDITATAVLKVVYASIPRWQV